MEPQSPPSNIKFAMFRRNEDLIRITSFVILITTMIIFILNQSVPYNSWRFSVSILLITALLVMNIFWHQIEDKMPSEEIGSLFFAISSVIITLLIAWIGLFYNILFLIFMVAAQTFMMLKPRLAGLIVAVYVILYLVSMGLIGVPLNGLIDLGISLLVGLVFVITLSLVLTRYVEQTERAETLTRQLQTANLELIAARQREKELVIAEERVRLARDIHDGIGHHLTALNIQLQAAEKLLQKQPERAAEAVKTSRKEAKAALEEVRRSVAVMRRSPLDGKTLQEALSVLVQDYTETYQKSVVLDVDGLPLELNPQIASTLFRAAQEGLTNIQKHASDADHIQIRLFFRSNLVTLTVSDNGSTADHELVSSGFGLAGLQERAEQLDGAMTWRKIAEGGSELKVEIPLPGGVYDQDLTGR